jgi:hypothetical protein
MFWPKKSPNVKSRDGVKQGVETQGQSVRWAGISVFIMGTDDDRLRYSRYGVLGLLVLKLVRSRRLELPQGYPHSDLNAARLPFRHDRTPHNVSDILHHGKAFSLRRLWDRLKTSIVLTGF